MKKNEINDGDFIDLASKLGKLSLFEELPEKILVHFNEKSRFLAYPKGKLLFFHGDKAEWFFVIVKGWVKLFRETIEGSEAVIDVLTEGDVFGENSIFNDEQYIFSAEVVEDVEFIAFPTSLLKYYVEKEKQVAINLLSSMSKNQRLQSREIEHLNVQNAPQRIGCFLLRLCKENRQNKIILHLPYDKTLIAARLGMKPETFSRALSKLKNDTDIKISGSTVTITNIQKIIDYTCNHCSQSFSCEGE